MASQLDWMAKGASSFEMRAFYIFMMLQSLSMTRFVVVGMLSSNTTGVSPHMTPSSFDASLVSTAMSTNLQGQHNISSTIPSRSQQSVGVSNSETLQDESQNINITHTNGNIIDSTYVLNATFSSNFVKMTSSTIKDNSISKGMSNIVSASPKMSIINNSSRDTKMSSNFISMTPSPNFQRETPMISSSHSLDEVRTSALRSNVVMSSVYTSSPITTEHEQQSINTLTATHTSANSVKSTATSSSESQKTAPTLPLFTKRQTSQFVSVSTSSSPQSNFSQSTSMVRNTSVFVPFIPKGDGGKNFDKIIIGVSVGAGALFFIIMLIALCYLLRRRRRKAPHRSVHYRFNYSTPEKGQDELLGSKDSIEMYANLKYAFRDGIMNKGLDSNEGSLTTLPGTSRSTAPLTNADSTFRGDAVPDHLQPKNADVFGGVENTQAAKYDVTVKLLQPWSDSLSDDRSYPYKRLKEEVEDGIKDLYRADHSFRKAKVKGFRPGSVITDLSMSFNNSSSNPLARLRKAVSTGHLGTLMVDQDHPVTAPARIRSTGSTSHDVIPLDTSASTFQRSDSQPFLLQNGEPAPGANYVVPITGSTLDDNSQDTLFNSKQKKSKPSPGTYENFSPLQIGESKKTRSLSTFDNAAMQEDDDLTQMTPYTSDTTLNRDSGYVGSPTSLSASSEDVVEETISTEIAFRKDSRQDSKSSPVPVQPPTAPRHSSTLEAEDSGSKVYVALFDFEPQDSRELSLRQGELVTVLAADETGWVKISNESNAQGWVPESFLVMVSSSQVVTTKATVETLEYFDSVMEELDEAASDSTQPASPENEYVALMGQEQIYDEPDTVFEENRVQSSASDGAQEYVEIPCVGLFSFTGENNDELSFKEGERVQVSRKTSSGWWKGSTATSEGWFPSSYVKVVDEDTEVSEVLEKANDEPAIYENTNPISESKKKDGGERPESPNLLQPPEKYTGLFVQILKRQSASDLGDNFRMEDFTEGPSKPERVVPPPPTDVEADPTEHSASNSLKRPVAERNKKKKDTSKGLPPQKPVPPPPTSRTLAKKEDLVEEAEINVVNIADPDIPQLENILNKTDGKESNNSSLGTTASLSNDSVQASKPRVLLSLDISSSTAKSEKVNDSNTRLSTDTSTETVSTTAVKPDVKCDVVVTTQACVAATKDNLTSPPSDKGNVSIKKSPPPVKPLPLSLPNSNTVEKKIEETNNAGKPQPSVRQEKTKPNSPAQNVKQDKRDLSKKKEEQGTPPKKPLPSLKETGREKGVTTEATPQASSGATKNNLASPPSDKGNALIKKRQAPDIPPLPDASSIAKGVVVEKKIEETTNEGKPQSSVRQEKPKPNSPALNVKEDKRDLSKKKDEQSIAPKKPLPSLKDSGKEKDVKTEAIPNKKDDEKWGVSVNGSPSVPGKPVKRTESLVGETQVSPVKQKPPVPVKKVSLIKANSQVLQNENTNSESVDTNEKSGEHNTKTGNAVKPRPAPRRDKSRGSSVDTPDSVNKPHKPTRPPPPSLKAKLEGERIALKVMSDQVHGDKSKVRTVVKPYVAKADGELTFETGAILYELEVYSKHGVGYGLLENGKQGYYPLSYVELTAEQA